MERPLLWWAVAFLAGCQVGAGWQPDPLRPLCLAAALCLAGAAARLRWVPVVALFLVGAALASRAATTAARDALAGLDGRQIRLTGRVRTPPSPRRFLLDTPQGPVQVGGQARLGDEVVCTGPLAPLDGPRNPLEPDPRPALWRQGCHHQMGAARVRVLRHGDRISEVALHAVTVLWPSCPGVMRGLLLGDRSGLEPRLSRLLDQTGTSHLMVASGIKVAALAMLCGWLLQGAPRGVRCLLLAGLLGTYAGVAGFTWPVLRASLLAFCAGLADAVGETYDGLAALGAAALALAAFDPLAVLDPGFRYSFAGMLGIYGFRDAVGGAFGWLPPRVRDALTLTVCIQLALLPLLVAETHTLSWVPLVANAVAVPLVEGVVMAAFPVLLLAVAGLRLAGAAALLQAVVAVLVGFLGWLPAARMALPMHAGGEGTLQVTFLDVGQGDSAWIRLPDGQGMLVDAGPDEEDGLWNAGDRTVAPFLLRSGVGRVSLAVVTHPHLDHYGGVLGLAETLPLGTVVEGGLQGSGGRWDAYRGVVPHPLRWQAGEVFALPDGVVLRVLHPGPVLSPQPNNASVVFRLEWRRVRMLFCGDAEKEAEAEMLARAPDELRADVLKVPHHGSATSSTQAFLDAVRPALAVVSVGRHNRFGLPNADTMDRLARCVPCVMRTDRDGGVVVETDGVHVWARGTTGGVGGDPKP